MLTNPEQVKSMHAEIGLLDFEAIQAQAGDVTQCDGEMDECDDAVAAAVAELCRESS